MTYFLTLLLSHDFQFRQCGWVVRSQDSKVLPFPKAPFPSQLPKLLLTICNPNQSPLKFLQGFGVELLGMVLMYLVILQFYFLSL